MCALGLSARTCIYVMRTHLFINTHTWYAPFCCMALLSRPYQCPDGTYIFAVYCTARPANLAVAAAISARWTYPHSRFAGEKAAASGKMAPPPVLSFAGRGERHTQHPDSSHILYKLVGFIQSFRIYKGNRIPSHMFKKMRFLVKNVYCEFYNKHLGFV